MFKAYLLFTFVLGENCNSLKRWLIYIRVIGNSPVKLPFVWLRFSSLGFPKNCSPFLIFSMLETICSLLILWWKSTPRTFSLARLKMCSIHAAISISFYMCVIKSVHDASFPQRLFLPGGCPTKPLWPIRTSQPPLRDPPQQKTKKNYFTRCPFAGSWPPFWLSPPLSSAFCCRRKSLRVKWSPSHFWMAPEQGHPRKQSST